MASQISSTYGTLQDEYTASMISAVNIEKREFQKSYMDYWNSTIDITGTGRPVDAIIAPLAPFAAARPDMYKYYGTSIRTLLILVLCRNNFGNERMRAKRIMPGFSVWVNLLDYPAAVLPVTLADKNVDVADKEYKPLSDQDEKVHDACKFANCGCDITCVLTWCR